MLQFDPTFRVGDITSIVAMIGGGFFAYYKLKEKILGLNAKHDLHALRLERIEAHVEDAKVDIKNSQAQDLHIAQLRNETNRIWDLLEELRHWRGFVNPDGEYSRNFLPPDKSRDHKK